MQPEHIPVDAKLKQAVRSANASYKERLQREKELERKKKEEQRMRKEISEKEKQEKLWLIERKESLAMSEKDLSEQERIV